MAQDEGAGRAPLTLRVQPMLRSAALLLSWPSASRAAVKLALYTWLRGVLRGMLTSPRAPPGSQVKQSWNLTEKTFVVTSNSRNENMLREAGDFAGHLKRCEKEIRTLKNATEGAPWAPVTLYPALVCMCSVTIGVRARSFWPTIPGRQRK